MLSCCPNKWWSPMSSLWLNSLSFTRFFQPSPNIIAVIVIEQLAAVGDKLLRNCALINRAKIDSRLII